MGTGYTRNDVSNNIAIGNTINASDIDGEFDSIVAAFDSSTGHSHDGTSAEGAPITKTGPAQEYLFDGTAIYPKTDDTYDLGKSGAKFRNIYIDGTANIDTLDVTVAVNFNSSTVNLQDTSFTISDGVDTTKKIAFQASGISTSTTRTYTMPDANGTVVLQDTTDTLSNKTLTSPTIDLSTVTSSGDLAISDGGTGASSAAAARQNLGFDTESPTVGTTTTLNLNNAVSFIVNLDQNTSLDMTNMASNVGQSGVIVFNQDATGGWTFTLDGAMKTPQGGAAISQTTTANSTSILSYFVASATVVLVNYIGDFA